MPEKYQVQIANVSRHGFEEHGVDCPLCQAKAVSPGDWRQVHVRERIVDGVFVREEGVCCQSCNTYLQATPDTDIDPITEGEPYDLGVYHTFVRPDGWEPPTQRTMKRPPEEGDWVVFTLKGSRAEGRCVSVDGLIAKIRPPIHVPVGTNTPEGEKLIDVPIADVHPMQFESLRIGDAIRIIRGAKSGSEGELRGWRHTDRDYNVLVALTSQSEIEIPIEWIEKIYPDEEEEDHDTVATVPISQIGEADGKS